MITHCSLPTLVVVHRSDVIDLFIYPSAHTHTPGNPSKFVLDYRISSWNARTQGPPFFRSSCRSAYKYSLQHLATAQPLETSSTYLGWNWTISDLSPKSYTRNKNLINRVFFFWWKKKVKATSPSCSGRKREGGMWWSSYCATHPRRVSQQMALALVWKLRKGKKQNERKKNTSKVPRIYIEMSGMISELRSLHAFVLPYSIWWRNSTVAPPLLYYKILKCWKNRKGGKKEAKRRKTHSFSHSFQSAFEPVDLLFLLLLLQTKRS